MLHCSNFYFFDFYCAWTGVLATKKSWPPYMVYGVPFSVSPIAIPLKREDSFFTFLFRVRLESVRRLSTLGNRILTERTLCRHDN